MVANPGWRVSLRAVHLGHQREVHGLYLRHVFQVNENVNTIQKKVSFLRLDP